MKRVLLAGDAAGLINSLNGEGIQYALLSGRWAAECLKHCLTSNDHSISALQKYEQKIKNVVGYDMCFSNMVIQFIRNRNLNPLWLKLLEMISEKAAKDEAYAKVAGGILAGLVPANKAISVSFLGKSVGQGVNTAVKTGFDTIKKGPVGIATLGIQSAGFAVAQLTGMLQNPGEYVRWMKGIANNGLELSGYILRDMKERIAG